MPHELYNLIHSTSFKQILKHRFYFADTACPIHLSGVTSLACSLSISDAAQLRNVVRVIIPKGCDVTIARSLRAGEPVSTSMVADDVRVGTVRAVESLHISLTHA